MSPEKNEINADNAIKPDTTSVGKLGTNPVCKYKKTPAQTISETKQIVKLTSFQRSSSVYNFYTIFQ